MQNRLDPSTSVRENCRQSPEGTPPKVLGRQSRGQGAELVRGYRGGCKDVLVGNESVVGPLPIDLAQEPGPNFEPDTAT